MVIRISTKIKWCTRVVGVLFFCNHTSMVASTVMTKAKLPTASVALVKEEGVRDEPFAFPIAAQVYHPSSAQGYKAGIASWFVGVGEPLVGDDGAYSLAYAHGGSPILSPLVTSTTVFVNNVPDQPHPLRGRPIALLKLLGISPLVVPADNLSELILFNISTAPHRVLRITLLDADTKPVAAVDATVLQNPNRIPDVVMVNPNMTVAVAIRPLAGVFGDPGSGISMVMTALAKNPNDDKQRKDDSFKPEELAMGVFGTILFDRMSSVIAAGHPVASMKNFVTLHACETLNKIFVGVNVTSNVSDGDGVFSVLVVDIDRTPGVPISATMEPVVSQTIMGTDCIVAARTSQSGCPTVAAHGLRTMRTSTGLDYLIVHGGNGDDNETSLRVFALPLIRTSGKLAHAYAPPVTSYYGKMPLDRLFVTLPESATDLYTSSSTPAIVGGGAVHAPIIDIVASGDAVFVATSSVAGGRAPGIWHSQAIFGTQGTIISWTPWRRTGGASSSSLKGFSYNEHAGTWWLTTADGQARMTTWNTSSPLSILIKETIGKQGGVRTSHEVMRGIFPGLLVISGHDSVVLVQTDQAVDGVVSPRADFSKGYTSADGTLRDSTLHSEYAWLAMRGGALTSVGVITSAVIAGDDQNMWVIVAGSKGIAILMKPDGVGCAPGENFVGVTPDMVWYMLPLYVHGEPVTNVRKLIYEHGFLYILTTHSLLRVSLRQVVGDQEHGAVTTLATMNGLSSIKNSTCADVFIAGPLACIATSVGCFRSGNGVNLAVVACERDVQWTRVDLPHSPGPVVSLVPVGPVAHRYDNGYDANLYVLSAAATSVQARIYRIAISHTGTVADDTVSLFPDEIVQGKRGFFLSIGDYRNRIATDGSLLFAARNRYGKQHAYVELYPGWCSWPLGLTKSINIVRSGYRGILAEQAAEVSAMIHSSGLGSWLVLTDIGLISNE